MNMEKDLDQIMRLHFERTKKKEKREKLKQRARAFMSAAE